MTTQKITFWWFRIGTITNPPPPPIPHYNFRLNSLKNANTTISLRGSIYTRLGCVGTKIRFYITRNLRLCVCEDVSVVRHMPNLKTMRIFLAIFQIPRAVWYYRKHWVMVLDVVRDLIHVYLSGKSRSLVFYYVITRCVCDIYCCIRRAHLNRLAKRGEKKRMGSLLQKFNGSFFLPLLLSLSWRGPCWK